MSNERKERRKSQTMRELVSGAVEAVRRELVSRKDARQALRDCGVPDIVIWRLFG